MIGCQSSKLVLRSSSISSSNNVTVREPDSTPRLRIESHSHTAPIRRIDVDQAERYVVTASFDKTARVWDAENGELLRILRPPIGDGHEGEINSIAITPDGAQIAIAGWIGIGWKRTVSIYIFDRESGQLQSRIRGLPKVILHLDYSPDGRHLAAALGDRNGIRIFRTSDYQEVARDSDYGKSSYSVEFGADNQLVTTSGDGYIRLYDSGFNLVLKRVAPGGEQPYFARFSPNGRRIAVGFLDSTKVNLLSAETLASLESVNTKEIENGDFNTVTWSRDGPILYSGGRYDDNEGLPMVSSSHFRSGARVSTAMEQNATMGLYSLSNGDFIVGTADPILARLDYQGNAVWKQNPGTMGFLEDRTQLQFNLSDQGTIVDLKYYLIGKDSRIVRKNTSWSLSSLNFTLSPTEKYLYSPRTYAPELVIKDWEDSDYPKLNGQLLPLEPYETSRSLAIDSDGRRFTLGSDLNLRLFDHSGTLLWKHPVPFVWAVNISQDNRYIVTALGDGTLRWHQLDNGRERLALYINPDEKRWVAWTPEGFFAAAPDAESLIGYHLNRGLDREADFVNVEQLREVFSRRDLVVRALDDDFPELAQRALEEIGNVREILLSGGLPPGIRLKTPREIALDQREFTLEFSLDKRGGGVGKVEYRVDGQLVGSNPEFRPFAPEIDGQSGYKRRFTLSHGIHRITIVVYNALNQVASKPVEITVKIDDPVYREPSLYVLSLGVTQYRDRALNLKYAADDAIDFSAVMEKRGRGLYKKVITRNLVDSQVTLQNIGKTFNELAEVVEPQDVFVLFMAGHGIAIDGRYHFIPYDLVYSNQQALRAGSLDEERLKTLLSSINAGKRLLVIDSCQAGSALPTLAYLSRGMDDKAAIDRLMQATGQTILAAASEKQQALAGIVENGEGHGLFSHVLLKGLRGAADGILRRDGQIDVEELALYLKQEVPRISMEKWHYEQFPMHHVERNFPIVLSSED